MQKKYIIEWNLWIFMDRNICTWKGKPPPFWPRSSQQPAGNLWCMPSARSSRKYNHRLTTSCAFVQVYKTAFVTKRKSLSMENTEDTEQTETDPFQRCTAIRWEAIGTIMTQGVVMRCKEKHFFFIARVIKCCNSASLKVFKTQLEKSLDNLLQSDQLYGGGWTTRPWRSI